MESLRLEEVFKISGVPTHTFVEPAQYSELKVALRTAAGGVVVEGPSGIGKSTAVTRAIDEIDHPLHVTRLSARVPGDIDYINLLPELSDFGLVVVDDFGRAASQTSARRRYSQTGVRGSAVAPGATTIIDQCVRTSP